MRKQAEFLLVLQAPCHTDARPGLWVLPAAAEDIAYVPQVMVADINACKGLDAHGVVIGCLQPDGTVDIQQTGALVQAAQSNVSQSGDCFEGTIANAGCWLGLKKRHGCGMSLPRHKDTSLTQSAQSMTLYSTMQGLDITFHRAFDVSRDLRYSPPQHNIHLRTFY